MKMRPELSPARGLAILVSAALLLLPLRARAEERKTYQEIELAWPSEEEIEVLRAFPDLEVIRAAEGELVRLLSTPEITQGLIDAGLRPHVAVEDAAAFHMAGRSFAAGLGAFLSYAEAIQFLDSIHAAYPEITTEKESIGASWEGRTIWAMKISDNPNVDEDEPEVLLDALHHAREPITISVLTDFMRHLCENYGSDPEATFLVNEREIWFVPVVNPDGYVWNEMSGGTDMMWRKNRRDNSGTCEGVDLNRNYGYQWGGSGSSSDPCDDTYRGPSGFSEPETQAMQGFILAHDFVTHDSYHSYAAQILYPWGYTSSPCPDAATFDAIGTERSRDNGYEVGSAGGTLYLASGITVDWAYGADGVYTYTTEVGGSWFWPAESEIPGLVAENLYSNIHLAIAAGSYVRLASAAVLGGDGNGRLDPGETAEIRIVLENAGVLAGADGVRATIACDDPYVQLIDASSLFGSIAAGGSASSASDPFTIAVDQGVPDGREIVFRVSMTWSGASNEETATFPIGAPIASDDFESGNHGWSQDPSHTASTGAWALVDPNPTAYQPGDDATPPPGAICWVTAQNSAEGTDDVDNGISALRSPVWDLSAHGSVALYLNYFHGQRDPGDDAGDFFRIDLSNNGGATFPANLLLLGDAYHAPAWTALQVRLEDHLPLTSQMVLRLQAADGLASGDIVEAGIDDLALLSGGGGNEPPAAPLLLAPADGEPVGPAPELVLQNAVDPEADPLSYGFLVYSDSLLTSVVRAANAVPEGAGQTSWIVVPPLGDGTFWWRAYAEDWAAAGLCSAPFTFTIDASTGIAAGGAAAPFYAPTPNPATSAGTTIRFLLPSGGRVRADVFDAAGRRVRQIARGVFPAGVQTLQWDGRDQRGAEAAAGVYFVRIRTDEEEKAVKVILVR